MAPIASYNNTTYTFEISGRKGLTRMFEHYKLLAVNGSVTRAPGLSRKGSWPDFLSSNRKWCRI